MDGPAGPGRRTGGGWVVVVLLYAATIGLSAALLFTLQPMFAKLTLPLLGGAPSVWNTAMVFYQAMLLAGYAYAFALCRLPSRRVQVGVHAALALSTLVFLPPVVSPWLGSPDPSAPVAWLIGTMAVSIGALCLLMSATAPLVQHWYAGLERPGSDNPYVLYAASNLGSFGALAAYPLLVEPMLGASAQVAWWSAVFVGFLAALLGAGVLYASRQPHPAHSSRPVADATSPAAPIPWLTKLRWTALAAVPSGLLLAVTGHIAADIASAPLLWVVPLALYLLTFVFAFADQRARLLPWASLGAGVCALVLLAPLRGSGIEWTWALSLHLLGFFIIASALHGRLAAARPPAARLTEFYLWLALGGVIGGAITALLAPVVFDDVHEYPLLLVLALALLVRTPARRVGARIGAGVAGLALLAVGSVQLLFPDLLSATGGIGGRPAVIAGAVLAGLALAGRPIILACIGAGLAALVFALGRPDQPIAQERSFFGVLRVTDDAQGLRRLDHGTTIHGIQSTRPGEERLPMAYYGPATPIARAIRAVQDSTPGARVGIVGLGTGASACWARPGERWTFFEIDPAVRDLAFDPAVFSFHALCTPTAPVVMGDARLTLQQKPENAFDVLLIDAFSSDMVPTHLMTQEAMRIYLSRISERGIVILHVSNRMMALEGVAGDVIGAIGAHALVREFTATSARDRSGYNFGTDAVVVARSAQALALFDTERCVFDEQRDCWRPVRALGQRPWSDDHSNVLGAIIAKRQGMN